jgi:hypothetical protein
MLGIPYFEWCHHQVMATASREESIGSNPLKFIRRILQPFPTIPPVMPSPVSVDYIIGESALIHSTDIAVASAALIIYDHIITFDQEVSVMLLIGREVTD